MTARYGTHSKNEKKPLDGAPNKTKRCRQGNSRSNDPKGTKKIKRERTSKLVVASWKTRDAMMSAGFPQERSVSFLPIDPMQWSRNDVTVWLRIMSSLHQFELDYGLFVMNGKGLCLMSLDGFRYRSPRGGAILYTDLRKKILTKLMVMSMRKSAM